MERVETRKLVRRPLNLSEQADIEQWLWNRI